MKNKITALIIGATLLSIAGVASAQFGGLGKNLTGLTSGSSDSASPESIVNKYVGGSRYVSSADIKMLRAVGMKEDADRAELHAKNLTEGATKDALEEATKSQTESSKALEAKLKEGKLEMDAQSKEQFSAGMADLARGLIQYIGMRKEVTGFKPGVSAIGASTTSALFVVKTLPDSVKNLAATLSSSIAFAKSNNIPVPKEASDATSAI